MNTRRRCCRPTTTPSSVPSAAPSAAPTTTAPTSPGDTYGPSTAPTFGDLCVEIDSRRKCRSKKAKRWLGCKWSMGACAVKRADFTQPTPLECGGAACCELNKAACKGRNIVNNRVWRKKYGKNPKKVCKYTKDKSMQNKTPDGKCDQELHLMGAHKPNIKQPIVSFRLVISSRSLNYSTPHHTQVSTTHCACRSDLLRCFTVFGKSTSRSPLLESEMHRSLPSSVEMFLK